MKQVVAPVISKGEPIEGLDRPYGRSIKLSQTIRFRCPEIAQEAKPGQFIMVDCGKDCTLPRPFSIHQAIDKEDLALYFAVLEGGKGTEWLSQRKVNDRVRLLGPLGNGFSIHPASHNLLLVAGGMGIAPLHFLAQEALDQGCSVTLLYGTANVHRYPEGLFPSGIKLVAATEDGAVGYQGMITDLLPKYIDWADQVFVCGPTAMYRDMCEQREKLLKAKSAQVSLEVVMGCGRGLCYGCTVKTKSGLKKVCQDGPVFDLDDLGDIRWDDLII